MLYYQVLSALVRIACAADSLQHPDTLHDCTVSPDNLQCLELYSYIGRRSKLFRSCFHTFDIHNNDEGSLLK